MPRLSQEKYRLNFKEQMNPLGYKNQGAHLRESGGIVKTQ